MAFMNMEPTSFGTREAPVAADAVGNAGEIACWNEDGYAVPGSVATGLRAFGVFKESFDNTGGADGDVTALVMWSIDKDGRRVFPLLNASGGDAVTQESVSHACFISGPNTVADNDGGGTRSRAGKVHGIDEDGRVEVEFDCDYDSTDISALQADVAALEALLGTAQRGTTGAMVAGAVTVSTATITASSVILYSRKTTGGTVGHVAISAQSNGAPGSFTLTSSSNTETSTFNWAVLG